MTAIPCVVRDECTGNCVTWTIVFLHICHASIDIVHAISLSSEHLLAKRAAQSRNSASSELHLIQALSPCTLIAPPNASSIRSPGCSHMRREKEIISAVNLLHGLDHNGQGSFKGHSDRITISHFFSHTTDSQGNAFMDGV